MHRRDTFLLVLVAVVLAASAQCVTGHREPPAPVAPAPALVVDDDAWLDGVELALLIEHPDLRSDLPVESFTGRAWY